MKLVILSDIHGNIWALKECMKFIDNSNFDAIIWCGDYVTDFSGSHDVIQIIQSYSKKYKSYIISGNREKNIVEYANGKQFCIRQRKNLEYTCKLLTIDDIKWLESLPESIVLKLDDGNKIYVSHKCTYEDLGDCKYKIFGHSHKQYSFVRSGVKYINPGSVGIPTDGNVGAQFTILEINDKYEKLEHYTVKYDIDGLIQNLKSSAIYNDEVKWGRLLEKELQIGIDYPQRCIEEYERIRGEHHFMEESLEAWNIAVENVVAENRIS